MKDRLYNLLPAIYRIRDAECGQPLRALLGIIEEQLEVLEEDINGLYDDWFIETSQEWVIPYIGDLLGVRMLHNVESTGVYSQRVFVANTIGYRQRKGTLLMLEDLARTITGWGAHAFAFFELLGWTQHLNHLRFNTAPNPNPRNPEIFNPVAVNRVGTVNLRSLDVVDRIDGAFDEVSHTVDIRPPRQLEGWYNIRNLGIFLWRLQSYPMRGVKPRASEDHPNGFHFSPLGNRISLFTNPRHKRDDKRLSTEVNVPGPIRSLAFFQNPGDFYGSDTDMSLAIYQGTTTDPENLVPLRAVLCQDLRNWSPPPPGMVAIDVSLGRFAFAEGETPTEVMVDYHYGFSADIGAGPYDRRTSMNKAGSDDWEIIVAKEQPNPPPVQWHDNVAEAIQDWNPELHPRAVITITDNGTYDENLMLDLGNHQHLIIQAGNLNRPVVRLHDGDDALSVLTITGGASENAVLTLNGLLVEGGIQVHANSLGKLEIIHCTLAPGRALDEQGWPKHAAEASIVVDAPSAELEIEIEASIVGALRLPEHMQGLKVTDSIIDRPKAENENPDTIRVALAQNDDGDLPGPVTVLERSTIFGEVHVHTLTLAAEVIFTQRVKTKRRQLGCVRYSYVGALESVTPRRFRCQPDLALENRRKQLQVEMLTETEKNLVRSRIQPDFTSMCYGHPGYAQLSLNTASEICTGAEDGSEMGMFEHLKQPQRETNLRIRLEEYMPYGLEPGIFYIT